jgi:hypothetical protein
LWGVCYNKFPSLFVNHFADSFLEPSQSFFDFLTPYMKKTIITLVISLLFMSLNATTRYVTTSGAGTFSGTSWANAANDLQLTINNSSSGDEIWVAAGTYKPNRRADALGTITATDRTNSFVLKSGVKVYGGFAGTESSLSQRDYSANVTILSGDIGTAGTSTDNCYHVVISSGSVSTAELNGFKITGGYGTNSGSTVSVNSNSVSYNSGGGFYCVNSSPILKNLIIESNYSLSGGGIYTSGSSSPVISFITVSSNSTDGSGGGGWYNESASTTTATNCVFKQNTAGSYGKGGGIYHASSSNSQLTLVNVLFYENSSVQNGGGIYTATQYLTAINNTIAYNITTSSWADGGGISGNATLQNTIVWGNKKGTTISSNTNGTITFNYCLVENGTVSGTSIISNDNPRFKDTGNDNYSLNGTSPAINIGNNSYNSSVTDLAGNPRIFNSVTIDLGAYEYQSSLTGSALKTKTLYVKKGSTGAGTSWADAIGEFADGLKASDESGEVLQIWVAAGTYSPAYYAGNGSTNGEKSFVLQKDVKIYGGFAGTETSLSQRNWKNNATILSGGSSAYHVVISAGDVGSAEFDGFRITASGSSNSGSSTVVNSQTIDFNKGGGIYCCASSPILNNLVIYSNVAGTNGAGVFCGNGSAPVINNTLIYKNAAATCGGVYTDSSTPILTNCTITGNTGSYGSGAGVSGTATLKNSIIWNNKIGSSANNVSGTITYNYCLLQAGTVSGTTIVSNSDPLFVNASSDDYQLSASSPAIGLGNNSYVSSWTYDLAKYPRTTGTNVDMGAYEYISVNKWIGGTSSDSETASNWSKGTVLASNDYLEFDTSAQRDLVLGANHTVSNILNTTSKNIDVNGKIFTITGETAFTSTGKIITSAANSAVVYAGSGSQSIPNGIFQNKNIYQLTINNPVKVTSEGNLNVLGNISSTSGTIDVLTFGTTVTYAGSAAQTINSGAFYTGKFYNLTINNTSGVSLSGDVTVYDSLKINSGSQLIIPVSTQLKVDSVVVNNAGVSGILIKADSASVNGSFIFYGNPPLASVEMYSKAFAATYNSSTGKYSNYKWQYFGVPVQSVVANPAFYQSYLRKWNEPGTTSSSYWMTISTTDSLYAFKGYEITQGVAKKYTVSGRLTNSDYSSGQLSYTSAAAYPGQNILSNSYTAAININQINFGTETDPTVYLYNTGSYNDWFNNGGGSSSGTSPGQYLSVPKNLAGVGGLPSQIPSMQGFLVKALSNSPNATISIPYSSTVSKNTDQQRISRRNAAAFLPLTTITVSGGGQFDKLWLFTNTDCSHDYENGWDAYKFLSSGVVQIFARENAGEFQCNVVNDINNSVIGFYAGADTSYTFTFEHQNSEMYYPELFLIDTKTDSVINISQSGSTYTFRSTLQDTLVDRFRVVTSVESSPVTSNSTPTLQNQQQYDIYCQARTLYVNNHTSDEGKITVYDATGRLIWKKLFTPNSTSEYALNIPEGAYLVKAETKTGNYMSRIIVK